MMETDEHQRVVELLQEARLPEGEINPERLEENLRWLIHTSRPAVQAPAHLRQRVQALAAAHRVRGPSWRALLDSVVRPFSRRSSAGMVSLLIACLGLLLLFTVRARAQ